MSTRRPHVVVLLCAILIAAGVGCRDRGATGVTSVVAAQAPADSVPLPNTQGSLKFAVLGDFGTGERTQYDLADQMVKLHQRFKYDFVVLVGDNLYGSERPQDFVKKFELPYKPL